MPPGALTGEPATDPEGFVPALVWRSRPLWGVRVLLLFSSASLFALAKSGPDFRFSGSFFSSRFGGGVSVEGPGTASGSGGTSLVALGPSGMSKFLPSFFRRTPLKLPNQGNLCSRALRAFCSLFSFRESSLIHRRLENHAAAFFLAIPSPSVSILESKSHLNAIGGCKVIIFDKKN